MPDRREVERRKAVSVSDWTKKPTLGGFDSNCVKAPEGYEFAKLNQLGVVRWDFLEYTIGRHDGLGRHVNRRGDEGYNCFELEYEEHCVPTPSGKKFYVCRLATFGERCAVCDWMRKHGGTADPKFVKDMRGKTKHVWVVNDKPGDRKNKPKLLITGHFNRGTGFGELMVDTLSILKEDDRATAFALSGGRTFALTVKELPLGENRGTYKGVTRIDTEAHDYEYPASYAEMVPNLDNCIVDPGYEAVEKLMETGVAPSDAVQAPAERNGDEDGESARRSPPPADDDDRPAPRAPARKGKTAEECGLKKGGMVMYDGVEYEITNVSGDGTRLTLETQDGEEERGVSPEDVQPVKVRGKAPPPDDDDDDAPPPRRAAAPKDDDDDDAPPARPAKKPARTAAKDDDDDPLEDDDDDRPAKPRGKVSGR